MAVNPTLSLGVKPIEVQGPLEGYKNTLALKSMLDTQAMNQQMMRLREQEISKNSIEAQQLQRNLEGQRLYGQLTQKHTTFDANGNPDIDMDKVAADLDKGGHPEIAMAVREKSDVIKKQHQDYIKAQQEQHVQGATQAFAPLSQLGENKDDDQVLNQYNNWAAGLGQNPIPGFDPRMHNIQPVQDATTARKEIGRLSGELQTAQAQMTQRKETVGIAESQAKTQESAAKARIDADKTYASKINSMTSREQYQQELAENPDMAKTFGTDYDQARARAKSTLYAPMVPVQQQEMQAFLTGPEGAPTPDGKRTVRVDLGDGEKQDVVADPANFDLVKNLRMRHQIDQEKRIEAGVTEPASATYNVAPTKAKEADTAFNKARQDYITAKTSVNEARRLLDESKTGGWFSSGYAPIAAVMGINKVSGVNRLNGVELEAGSQLGSALDRMEQWATHMIKGTKLTPDQIKDLEDVEKGLDSANRDRFKDSVSGIDDQFKTQFGIKSEFVKKELGTSGPAATGPRPYDAAVETAAKKYGVDSKIVHSIIENESSGDPTAISDAGAVGLMQVLPKTAKSAGFTGKNKELQDPDTNIEYGVKIFSQMLKKNGGDVKKALKEYNSGYPESTDAGVNAYADKVMGGATKSSTDSIRARLGLPPKR